MGKGKGEALVLKSAEPINDGGRKYNIIYFVSIAVCLVIFIAMGSNGLGIIFSVVLGLGVGWLIKNKILETMSITLRNIRFKVENKIPYSELIHRLIPILTPLGAMIEKSADDGGGPIISFQGAIYDIGYNDDDSFYIWWRKNLFKAFFAVDHITNYRKEVIAMGIIGYHIQQVCDHYMDSRRQMEMQSEDVQEQNSSRFCGNCGKEIEDRWSVCPQCGNTLKGQEQKGNSTIKRNRKKKGLKIFLIAIIVVIGLVIVMSMGSDEGNITKQEQDTLEKLEQFTTLYKNEGRYIFLDDDENWGLTYTSENQFVIFENDTVAKCFSEGLGEGCFDEESISYGGFSYDIDTNESNIYLDVDIEDGHLTIASYDFDEEEYLLYVDGEKYETTKVFEEFVEKYELAESMQSDVEAFYEILKEYGLSKEDLLNIRYETIDEQFVPIEDTEELLGDSVEEQNSENIVREEVIEVDYPFIYGGIMDSVYGFMSEQMTGTDYVEYTYYDMDNDGYLEFFINYGTCNADMVWEIYSTNGNVAMKIGEISGNCGLFENGDGVGIYTDYCGGGYESINYVYIVNGCLVEETVFEGKNDNYGYYNGIPIDELKIPLETRLLREGLGHRFYY